MISKLVIVMTQARLSPTQLVVVGQALHPASTKKLFKRSPIRQQPCWTLIKSHKAMPNSVIYIYIYICFVLVWSIWGWTFFDHLNVVAKLGRGRIGLHTIWGSKLVGHGRLKLLVTSQWQGYETGIKENERRTSHNVTCRLVGFILCFCLGFS